VISLSLTVGDAAAGIFATGLRLIEVALMPLSFLGVAAYPGLSQLFVTSVPAFRRSAVDLMWPMLLGGGAVAWGLYFVAPSLLVPVLGQRFAGAEPVIQTMAVFALLQAVEVGLGRLLLCTDRQAANAGFVAVGAVVSVTLNVLLVPRYGIAGAIYSGAAGYAAINVLCLVALRRPLTGSALLRVIVSLGASLAVGAGVAALLASRGFSAWPQAIASLAGFALFGAAAYRYRHAGAAHGQTTQPGEAS
jgi:O-antigen/teichoic acid export membrane protein